MARIEAIDAEAASPEVRVIFDGARTLLGRVPRSLAVMSHSPKVARWMLAFVASIHRDGAGSVVEGPIKNLATLKTASLNGSTYSMGHNRAYGREFGMDDARFDALEHDYRSSELFDDREKAVLAWAEAVTRNTAQQDDVAFEGLKAYFSDAEIVELTMLICHFNGMNRFTSALQLELEQKDEVERIRTTRNLSVEDVDAYARSVSGKS